MAGTQKGQAVRDWGLPLLEKELIEQAVNFRTYAVRAIYAAVLLLICFCVLQNSMPYRTSLLNVLGIGRIVFWTLVVLQELGLYIALPILACGTITVERERKTLDLLLVTKLSPGTIVVEKFFSRLLPALNLLLLSAPMLAFSYSLGGMSLEIVVLSFYGLILTAIRLTAVGVLCSAVSKTTAQALVTTYLLIALLYLVDRIIIGGLFAQSFAAATGNAESWVLVILSRRTVYDLMINGTSVPAFGNLSLVGRGFIVGACSMTISALVLFAAQRLLFILSCGSSGRIHWMRSWLEGRRESRNERRSRRALSDGPELQPISWREGPRRGELVAWWARNLLVPSAGVFLFMYIVIRSMKGSRVSDAIAVGSFLVWIVVTLWLAIKASQLIVQERVRQTWDVLATTPLSGGQILQQKMAHVNRYILLVQIVLTECALLRLNYTPQWSYFFASAFIIALYPPIIAWQGVVCGMNAKNGAWAMLKTLLMLTARCLIPFLIAFLLAIGATGGRGAQGIFLTFISISPLTFLVLTQTAMNDPWPNEAAAIPFVSVISVVVVLVYLRIRASVLIERALGREELPWSLPTGENSDL